MKIYAFVILFTLVGCATPGVNPEPSTEGPGDLDSNGRIEQKTGYADMPDDLLIDLIVVRKSLDGKAAEQKNRELLEELRRRPVITQAEWDAIDSKTVFVGMSQAAVRLSMGHTLYRRELITESAATEVWRYGSSYVHFRDKVVVAIER